MPKHFRRWVYHKTEEPKIINSNEFEQYEKDGWSDTPATFAKIIDFGVDENDPAAVQVLGEAIEGVKNSANAALNIDVMNKKELEEYAFDHYGINLDRRRSIKALRKEVKEMAGI